MGPIAVTKWEVEDEGDLPGFLASAVDMDRSIEAVVAIADDVAARAGSSTRIRISTTSGQ